MNIKNTFVLPLLLAGALSYAETISANLYPGDGVTWSTSSIWEIDGSSADRLPGAGDQIVITTTDDGSGSYATVTANAGNVKWKAEGSLTLNGPTHLNFTNSNQSAWGNIYLNSGSALTVNGSGWSTFILLGDTVDGANIDNGKTVNFALEKGATFSLINAHFSPNSTHNKAPDTTANIDLKGDFSITKGSFFLAEGVGSTTNLNIYGSAKVSSDAGTYFGNGYVGSVVNMSFKMQDLRTSAIAGQADATIALFSTGTIEFRNNITANFIIDFSDFSIDGGSFIVGQTYNFALISAASGLDESIFDKISIANESALGSEWALAEDYLSISDNTLYLNLSRVPEPSTYAAIFAILALALAVYKKHR